MDWDEIFRVKWYLANLEMIKFCPPPPGEGSRQRGEMFDRQFDWSDVAAQPQNLVR